MEKLRKNARTLRRAVSNAEIRTVLLQDVVLE
jgi:hypothetical protein